MLISEITVITTTTTTTIANTTTTVIETTSVATTNARGTSIAGFATCSMGGQNPSPLECQSAAPSPRRRGEGEGRIPPAEPLP